MYEQYKVLSAMGKTESLFSKPYEWVNAVAWKDLPFYRSEGR